MISINSPSKMLLPFAEAGGKNAIPVDSQIGITPGAASLTDGFPPLTRTPIVAGGIPPSGLDMNGILYAITAIQQWQSAGGAFAYDAAFSAEVGGYPKGAVLVKATNDGFWLNTLDSNTSNPDTGGADWIDLGASLGGRPGHTYTANDWAYLDKPGGLIVQWGSTSVTAGTLKTISLPTTFPNLAFMALSTPGASLATAATFSTAFCPNTSQISLSINSGTVGVNFIAIGG